MGERTCFAYFLFRLLRVWEKLRLKLPKFVEFLFGKCSRNILTLLLDVYTAALLLIFQLSDFEILRLWHFYEHVRRDFCYLTFFLMFQNVVSCKVLHFGICGVL